MQISTSFKPSNQNKHIPGRGKGKCSINAISAVKNKTNAYKSLKEAYLGQGEKNHNKYNL